MYRGKSVAVVVPAYNEEKLLGRVIETMPDFVDRIYVVDDCSHNGICERVMEKATDSLQVTHGRWFPDIGSSEGCICILKTSLPYQ
jgi:cellulose synthase/poly-beta-1,6-N-acetylglucosamine synthase-like glycosyltransferase